MNNRCTEDLHIVPTRKVFVATLDGSILDKKWLQRGFGWPVLFHPFKAPQTYMKASVRSYWPLFPGGLNTALCTLPCTPCHAELLYFLGLQTCHACILESRCTLSINSLTSPYNFCHSCAVRSFPTKRTLALYCACTQSAHFSFVDFVTACTYKKRT